MSSPENHDFSDPRNEVPHDAELGPYWSLPLYETENPGINDWYTYLWCFCEISKRRTVQSIQLHNQEWINELSNEIQKLKSVGRKIDKRADLNKPDTEILEELSEFMSQADLVKPPTTRIERFEDDVKVVKMLIHDFKNAHTPMYFSLYAHQKSPSDASLQELEKQIIDGFGKLHTYSRYSEQTLSAIKHGETQEIVVEEIDLFQLLEVIERSLRSSLIAEDQNKSVQLLGIEDVRTFVKNHPELIFFGRILDIEGLLTNIGKNCVEQYSEVRDTKFPIRANDPRTMRLQMELEKSSVTSPTRSLIVSLTIIDRATGFTNKILQFGFTPGESEKKFGWGVGLGDYVPRLASYDIEMQFANYDFDTGHEDDPTGTGSITTILIPVKEKQ